MPPLKYTYNLLFITGSWPCPPLLGSLQLAGKLLGLTLNMTQFGSPVWNPHLVHGEYQTQRAGFSHDSHFYYHVRIAPAPAPHLYIPPSWNWMQVLCSQTPRGAWQALYLFRFKLLFSWLEMRDNPFPHPPGESWHRISCLWHSSPLNSSTSVM